MRAHLGSHSSSSHALTTILKRRRMNALRAKRSPYRASLVRLVHLRLLCLRARGLPDIDNFAFTFYLLFSPDNESDCKPWSLAWKHLWSSRLSRLPSILHLSARQGWLFWVCEKAADRVDGLLPFPVRVRESGKRKTKLIQFQYLCKMEGIPAGKVIATLLL